MSLLTPSQIADVTARASVADVARSLGAQLRKKGSEWVGSCPVCGGGKNATRFETKKYNWVCATCSDGGDVIHLVQMVRGTTFRESIEWLGGPRDLTPAETERLERERARRDALAAKEQNDYRERARRAGFAIWNAGLRILPGCPVADYLAARGLGFGGVRLRWTPDLPFYDGEAGGAVLHRGPALLAAMVRPDGRFGASHATFVDPSRPGEKAVILDPVTGVRLNAKKMRGSKKGSHIDLFGPREPERLFVGEGIETTLSVLAALRVQNALRDGDAFWAAGDLGNIGGKALETIAHPTAKTPHGRAHRVPGPVPDLSEPAIAIPDSVRDLVLLGDGDSDRVTVLASLKRAAVRYARAGRAIRIAMAPDGADFNDVLRGKS